MGGKSVKIRSLRNISRILTLPFIVPSFLISGITKNIDKWLTHSVRQREKKYGLTHLTVPFLEVTVSSRCTLQCIGCANLMQYYGINNNKKAYDIPIDILRSSITNFLSCVDHLPYIHIIGGEPFLYKDLDKLLEFLFSQHKIKKIGITTNGTIVPNNPLLIGLLQNPNVSLNISYYGEEISRKAYALKEFTNANNIALTISTNKIWYSFGNMRARNKSISELNKQFNQCAGCLGLIEYELHYCARSRHGTDLGIVKKRSQDFVDLRNIESIPQKRAEIKHYMERTEYIQACDHCDICTDISHSLTPGDQKGQHNIHTLVQ